MISVVLDASAAISFLVSSQSTPAAEAFRVGASTFDFIAPSVFSIEMRHALIRLERRNQVSSKALDRDLPELETIIRVMPLPTPRELSFMIALARNENLGIYDASYLAIALEHDCVLASRDSKLLEAAIHQNIDVIDLR
jgi:predicted nucleic acid-binding protein